MAVTEAGLQAPLYDAIGRDIDSLDARLAKSGSSKASLVVATGDRCLSLGPLSGRFSRGRICSTDACFSTLGAQG
jgi:hypothetical protein